MELQKENIEGAFTAQPLVDVETGEVIADTNTEMNSAIFDRALSLGIRNFKLIFLMDLELVVIFVTLLWLIKFQRKKKLF